MTKNVWLLPDRKQSGRVQAIQDGRIEDAHKLINLSELPSALILGIPEEIFRKNSGRFFIFSQFAILESGVRIFCISAPAGKDISGRMVAISNLQYLEHEEEPNLIPPSPISIGKEDEMAINRNIEHCQKNPEILSSTREMLTAAKKSRNKRRRTFSSEELSFAADKPDWMPQKKNKKIKIFQLIFLLFFLIILLTLFLQKYQ